MMARFLLLIVLSSILSATYAKPIEKSMAVEVVMEANKIRDAVLKKNYKYIINKFPSKILKTLGLKRKVLIENTEKIMKNIISHGLVYEEYIIKNPTAVYNFGGKSLVFVPIKMVIKYRLSKVVSENYLIAIKYNSDDSWYFIDGVSINSREIFNTYFKDAPDSIVLPEQKNTIVDMEG